MAPLATIAKFDLYAVRALRQQVLRILNLNTINAYPSILRQVGYSYNRPIEQLALVKLESELVGLGTSNNPQNLQLQPLPQR